MMNAAERLKVLGAYVAELAKNTYKDVRTGPGHGGYRSGGYTRPADFYNHGSKTFLKNKRRGL